MAVAPVESRSGARLIAVPTRQAMTALTDVSEGDLIFLGEPWREGLFECRTGRLPSNDPLQGLFVPSQRSGLHFSRRWHGADAQPEWFGARPGDADFDCLPALRACTALCQSTRLSATDYYIRDTFIFDRSGHVLRGTAGSGRDVGVGAPSPMGTAGGTRIILTGEKVVAATVFQFGKTSGRADDADLTRNAFVSDIAFARDCSRYRPQPSLDQDPINCVKGVIMSFMNACGMENVSSFDSPVGFHYFGVVASYSRDCATSRSTPASIAKNDFWVGHLIGGYEINFGYIGANASIYLQHPTCYDENAAFDTSIGIRLFGYIADTFIDDAEVGRVNIGIQIDGRDKDGRAVSHDRGASAHQDVRLTSCVIDSVSVAGIDIHDLNRSGQISINDIYAASANSSAVAVRVQRLDPGAAIDFTGGKLLGSGGPGVVISDAANISMRGTYVRDFGKPLVVRNVTCGLFEPKIRNSSQSAGIAAIEAVRCRRTSFRPQVTGGDAMIAAGMSLDGQCGDNSIELTMIDPACLKPASASRKILFDGKDARTSAPFTSAGNVLIGTTS